METPEQFRARVEASTVDPEDHDYQGDGTSRCPVCLGTMNQHLPSKARTFSVTVDMSVAGIAEVQDALINLANRLERTPDDTGGMVKAGGHVVGDWEIT
jgi:hypothetical protein